VTRTSTNAAPPAADLADLVEQLTARIQAGEDIDSAAVMTEHPEHAGRLAGLLPALKAAAALAVVGDSCDDGPRPNVELGDFRIVRQVGRGGMGIVYEAEQLSLRRRVALKVLPFASTMDPKQLQRFRNEALAAASLHHEHIVPVFAVGCERGVHYYAMQFIDGMTLAQVIAGKAESRGRPQDGPESVTGPYRGTPSQPRPHDTAPIAALSTERTGRGREFYRTVGAMIADAADALEYAHSLGIVHRDIKPGNLLIDGEDKAWVADFGLARFGPDAGLTMSGDLLGTLRYMAPEQALARHGLADHRVDVYGLGCTLYELLTGKPAVGGTDKAEILRRLAFEEPVALRKIDRAIPAELETIALKCLAKSPNERYATTGELAADLRRFVENKPIVAKPPSVMGRIDKWTRRHKYLTRSAIVVVTLIAVGLGIGAVLLDRQKQRAVTAEETATAVKDFFVYDLLRFAAADRQAEERGGGVQVDPDLKVRDVLLRAAREIDGKFSNQPLVEAEIRNTLGSTLNAIGLPVQAVPQLERARAIRSAILGPGHPGTLQCMISLAHSYAALGRRDEALKLDEEAVAIAKTTLGPDHQSTLRCMNGLAGTYNDHFGRHAEAAMMFEETLKLQKAKLGPDHPDTLTSMHNLTVCYDSLTRYAEGLKLCEETLALTKAKLGPDHPDTLQSMLGLAIGYSKNGRDADALKLREETLALMKAKLGRDHPDTLRSMNNLANSYSDLRRDTDALKLREETLALMKAKLGPYHADTLRSMNNLAKSYADLGRDADALKLREEVLALRKAKLGPDHPDTVESMDSVAQSYTEHGRHADALKLREELLAVRKARLGPDQPPTLGSMVNLGQSYATLDRHAEALKLYEVALPIMKAKMPDHEYTFNCMYSLAVSYAALGRHAEALKLYEEPLARWKVKLGPDHHFTLMTMHDLADSYAALGRHADALMLREEVLRLRKAKLGPDHSDTLESMNDLASSYVDIGRYAESIELYEQTLPLLKAKLGLDHLDTLATMNNLARGYTVLGRLADAHKLLEEALPLRKAKLGPDHPDTLMAMHNLALSYGYLDRDAEAVKLFEETLARRKARLGPDHPDTLETMNSLANSYGNLRRRAEATKLYEETLALRKGRLGTDHPDTLGTTVNLALSYAVLGRHDEAIKLYENALSIMKAKMPDHVFTFNCMYSLADSYAAVGRHSEALKLYEETLAQWKNKPGPNHPSLGKVTYAIACVHALMIPKSGDRPRQADLAMDWLKRSVAAGYRNVDHMKKDTDLAALRDRDDFKELIAELEAASKPAAEP
jgi:serine/threonine protein kinase/tetratricopeptide (TPR) repeat protein